MRRVRLAGILLLVSYGTAYAQQNTSADEEDRLTFAFAHPVAGRLSGNGSIAFEQDQDKDDHSFRLAWPSVIYEQTSWLQEWAGITDIWTNNEDGSTSLEARPFIGVQLSSPKSHRVRVLNLTRLEWLHMVHGNAADDQQRLRNRFDVEFPLTGRGWKARAYYGVAEVEPFFNLDERFIETVRVGGAVGSVLSDRLRIEGECLGQWTREADTRLSYGDTLLRVNVKFSFKSGLFDRIGSGDPGS